MPYVELYLAVFFPLFSDKVEDDEMLLEKFNRGLRMIRLNGRYTELIKEFEDGAYWAE